MYLFRHHLGYGHIFQVHHWTAIYILMWTQREIYHLVKELRPLKMKKISNAHLDYLHTLQRSLKYLYNTFYNNSLESLATLQSLYRESEKKRVKLTSQQDIFMTTVMIRFTTMWHYIMRATDGFYFE